MKREILVNTEGVLYTRPQLSTLFTAIASSFEDPKKSNSYRKPSSRDTKKRLKNEMGCWGIL